MARRSAVAAERFLRLLYGRYRAAVVTLMMVMDRHFLFISHVTEDRVAAMGIVRQLERRGMPCWIAPRDIHPGRPFDNEIVDAIEKSCAVLLVFSELCNESDYIRREITVAGESNKLIIPFRIEDAQPRRGLRARLSDLHWIDGFSSRERSLDQIINTLNLPSSMPAPGSSLHIEAEASKPIKPPLSPKALYHSIDSSTISNDKHVLEVRSGYRATASAASIAFLWSNWEILYKLAPGRIRATRISERTWKGTGFGGHGEWCLTNSTFSVNEGVFEFFCWLRFLGVLCRGMCIMEYKRISTTMIAYHGRCWGELPATLRPVRWLCETLAGHAGSYVNIIGGRTAELITQNADLVRSHADDSRYQVYLDLIAEEELILNGGQLANGYFSESRAGAEQNDWNQMIWLHQQISQAEKQLTAASSDGLSVSKVIGEVRRAVSAFEVEPHLGFIKIQEILDFLVKEIYVNEFHEEWHRNLPLKRCIDRFFDDGSNVPAGVAEQMRNIAALGSGAPQSSKRKASRIDYNQFKTSIDGILTVAEWHVKRPLVERCG